MNERTDKNKPKQERMLNISKAIKMADRDAKVLYDGKQLTVLLTEGEKK